MKKPLFLSVFLLLSLTIQAQDVVGFVVWQMENYPKSRLLDIYKSCFQDYMGAEHLVTDKGGVKAYLDEELNATTLEGLMPWYYEPCGTDGNYVRVSIRPVKEGIVSEDLLLDAFIRSANAGKRPSVESWRERWQEIVGTIDQMNLNLQNYHEDRLFLDSILSVGKYAISHSPEFREAYRPHYRIVERNIFEQEILPKIHKAMIVRIAEIEIYPEFLSDYLSAARNVGAESVRREPGVVCIFPMQMKEDSCQIRIIEIYRSQAAYESHLKTPHFLTYKQGTLHMVKSLKLQDQIPLDAPSMSLIFEKMK